MKSWMTHRQHKKTIRRGREKGVPIKCTTTTSAQGRNLSSLTLFVVVVVREQTISSDGGWRTTLHYLTLDANKQRTTSL